METYTFLANIAQTWGFAAFVIGFGLAIVYAVLPSNRDKFDRASRIPLDED